MCEARAHAGVCESSQVMLIHRQVGECVCMRRVQVQGAYNSVPWSYGVEHRGLQLKSGVDSAWPRGSVCAVSAPVQQG